MIIDINAAYMLLSGKKRSYLCLKELYSSGPYYSRISGTREESLKVNPLKMGTKNSH